jgi:hypothetical protein
MQEQRSAGCGLWSLVLAALAGLILLCICACCLFLVFFSAGEGNYSFNLNVFGTPTPINTCVGLLENIHQTPGANKNLQVDQRYLLDVYQVSGDTLQGPEFKEVPANLLPLQNDLAAQQLIWEYFTYLIPPEERQPLNQYRIFSDGSGNSNGYYEIAWQWQGVQQSQTWALEIDLADYEGLKSINDALIHEFGHMLTLNLDQIDIRTQPADCPAYADENQCSFPDSYLNQFYQQFWDGETFVEWQAITSQADPQAVKNGLAEFYQAHPDDFVREYAASAPKEDLADTWTYFVMTPRPTGTTLAEQKILFFYNLPKFVELRDHLRGRICQYYQMPE